MLPHVSSALAISFWSWFRLLFPEAFSEEPAYAAEMAEGFKNVAPGKVSAAEQRRLKAAKKQEAQTKAAAKVITQEEFGAEAKREPWQILSAVACLPAKPNRLPRHLAEPNAKQSLGLNIEFARIHTFFFQLCLETFAAEKMLPVS